MSDDIQTVNRHGGTIEVTARILRRFLPGQMRGLVGGILLLLFATGASLLQPWPLKLVLDSVIGKIPAPKLVEELLRSVTPVVAASPAILLLSVLCASLLVIELFM